MRTLKNVARDWTVVLAEDEETKLRSEAAKLRVDNFPPSPPPLSMFSDFFSLFFFSFFFFFFFFSFFSFFPFFPF